MTKKMSETYFTSRLAEATNHIHITLEEKAREYVRNGDRMHNFNVGAKKKDITREQVIDNMRLKHEISIDDMRQDIAEGRLPTKELVEEKFGDIINYFVLEKISILHKIDEKNEV
jgi:hypothetical protein